MLSKKLKFISILEAILLTLSLIGNIYGIIKDNPIQYVCNIIAIIFAIAYCTTGYKKEGQLYFKLFAWFLVLKEAIALLHMALYEEVPAISLLLILLCYTCTLILAYSLNLGKKKSYTLAIALRILSAITVIFVLIFDNYLPVLIYNLTRLLLASVLFLMVEAKYLDKDARNATI